MTLGVAIGMLESEGLSYWDASRGPFLLGPSRHAMRRPEPPCHNVTFSRAELLDRPGAPGWWTPPNARHANEPSAPTDPMGGRRLPMEHMEE